MKKAIPKLICILTIYFLSACGNNHNNKDLVGYNVHDLEKYYLTGDYFRDCTKGSTGCDPVTKKYKSTFRIYNHYAYIDGGPMEGPNEVNDITPLPDKIIKLKTHNGSEIEVCRGNGPCFGTDAIYDDKDVMGINVLSNIDNFRKNEKKLDLNGEQDYCDAMAFYRNLDFMTKGFSISYAPDDKYYDFANAIFTRNDGYIGIVDYSTGLPLKKSGYYVYSGKDRKDLVWQSEKPEPEEQNFWMHVNQCKVDEVHYSKYTFSYGFARELAASRTISELNRQK